MQVMMFGIIKIISIMWQFGKGPKVLVGGLLGIILLLIGWFISIWTLLQYYPVYSETYKDLEGVGVWPFRMAWPLFYDPGEPARWPAVLYDGYFDRVIEDSQSLNKIAHVELYPKHLSWSDAWYWLVDGYNTFMNAIQPDRKILKTTLLFSVVYIYYEGIIQNKTNNIKK